MSGTGTKLLLAVTIAAAVYAPALAAQDAGSTDGTDTLAPVVVVGQRELGYASDRQSGAMFGEVDLRDTPFQVSVYPIELLQDQQVRTLFDVSKNDASVVATDAATGFYDSIAIRGFALSNSSGYYREGLLYQNQAQSPFENKAAVEIVKGLTALRYGFTAPGGVVNYVLKRPTEQPYRFADVFADSHGGGGVHLDVGGPVSETLGFRFNAVLAREALFVDGIDGPRRMGSLFVTWRPTERLQVDVEAEYQFRKVEQNATLALDSFDPALTPDQVRGLLERYDRETYLGQSWTDYPTRHTVGSVRLAYEFAPGWTARAAVQKMDLKRDQNALYVAYQSVQANGDFVPELYYQPNQLRDPLTAEALVQGSFATGSVRHEVAAGVNYLWNRLTFPYFGFYEPVGTSNLFAPTTIANPQPTSDPSYTGIRQQQTALFVTDYVRVNEKLNVFAGVRYTRPRFESFFNEDLSRDSLYEESAVTPSGGIVVKPRPNVSIYASYAEGLESGGTAPIGTVNANAVLPPLESRQYEAGVKVDLPGGALFSLAAFQIDKGLELTNDQRVYVQDGRQVHRGLEVSLAGELDERFRVVASAQYLDAEIRRTEDPALVGRRPVNVPEFQASVYGDWRLPVAADLALSAGVFHSGAKYADELNTFRVDGLTRVDVGARYGFRLGRAQATLRAVLENVTDEDGFTGVNYSFQYAAPRTLRVSLSAAY